MAQRSIRASQLEFPATVTVANLAAITTTQVYVSSPLAIAANALKVGSVFRITAHGTCTSSVANTSTFTVRLGAANNGGTSLLATNLTAAVTGTDIPFVFEAIIVVRTLGASGTATCFTKLQNTGVTGISTTTLVVNGDGTDVTIDTTGALNVGLSFTGGGASTPVTFRTILVESIR